MPQPAQVGALADSLAEVYADAWARLQDEERLLLLDWPSLTRTQRLGRLRDLQQLVAMLADTADEQALRWAVNDLPAAYLTGAIAGVASGGALAGLDLDALVVLAADTYADCLAATGGVRRSAKDLVRRLGREHVADLLIRGETAQHAGRDLARALAGHGLSAVTYSNGARHGLADYTDMLLRTKTAQAYTGGTVGALAAGGVEWVEILDGPSCGWTSHDDGDKANGTLRTLGDAAAQPLSHPRCQRAVLGRPEVRSAAQAKTAPSLQTPAQAADQAVVERTRELAVARRAAAKALGGTVTRTTARLLERENGRITSPTYARRVAARQTRLDREARARARAARLAARTASRATTDG